jgi:hypothetical protein
MEHNMNQLLISQQANMAITQRVIALHGQGYTFDFSVTGDQRILCIQDARLFTIDQVMINLIDLCFDEINSCYKYTHTVETCCGDKGLLMDCRPCVNVLLAARPGKSNNNINRTFQTTI